MNFQVKDRAAYQKITDAFKKQRKGSSIADIVSETALPLNIVREIVPLVADEYSARLEVTESGEVLYSFPRGFKSKYRGFKAGLRRFGEKAFKFIKTAGKAVFKVWIMIMLIGYFALFMLIALGSLLISLVASTSSSEDRGGEGGRIGGFFFAGMLLDLIIRIWFYSELTKAIDRRYYGRGAPPKPPKRPLYKAIFSFIFGDDDPNGDWLSKEKQAVIAYLQNNRGVISLPEFMILTGKDSHTAESLICQYCAEFGGLPEATEDGTIVYRFDDLLLRNDTRDLSYRASALFKKLKDFSSNPKKMNVGFSIINAVNLLFGSYFLYNSLDVGSITTTPALESALQGISYLYGVTYIVATVIMSNPLPLIMIGLGIIPLVFSILFWMIPALRFRSLKKDNENTKLENLRKTGYSRIWTNPLSVKAEDIRAESAESSPQNMDAARDKILKEMGSYAMPDVNIDNAGETVYVFNELDREKAALRKYRGGIGASSLGRTVFDSDA